MRPKAKDGCSVKRICPKNRAAVEQGGRPRWGCRGERAGVSTGG